MINYDTFLSTPSHSWDNRVYFSIKDIQSITSLPSSTISSFISSGRLKGMKVGRKWIVQRYDLFLFLQEMSLLSTQ